MKTRSISWALASALSFAMAGCTMTSDGLEMPQPGIKRMLVDFHWRGIDELSGTMTAGLPDGRRFDGVYFRITQELPIDRLAPLWDGWSEVGLGWRHWRSQPGSDFLKHYEGKVVATLGMAGGQQMRCRFRLVRPRSGMRGGGEGLCQLSDGTIIDAAFSKAPGTDSFARK